MGYSYPSRTVRPSIAVTKCGAVSYRSSLFFTVFLGFTKDPYLFVRSFALDGLVSLCKCIVVQDHGMIEGCDCRAVELLFDVEDCVGCSDVRVVRI